MLSYQHAYHAGHAADIAKHSVLALVLEHFLRKPTPLTYFDTHAGRGMYPLDGAEAQKTQEFHTGLVPVLAGRHAMFPEGLDRYFDLLARLNPTNPVAYPGSPAVAQALLRADDSLVLAELHPGEREHLKTWAKAFTNVHVLPEDGHLAVPARVRSGQRTVVLIDPSYEQKDEYTTVVETCGKILARWPQACIIIWYPMLAAGRHEPMLRGLKGLNRGGTYKAEITWDTGAAMYGSGQVVINLPYGLDGPLKQTFTTLAKVLNPAKPMKTDCAFLLPPV